MQNDDAARALWIEILLDDKTKGWAKSASTAWMRELYPEMSETELEPMARRVAAGAWACRDELAGKPSSELQALALAVAERQKRERAAAEYKARIEQEAAMFAGWARKAYWSPKEAALLALGLNPAGRGTDDDAFYDLTDTIDRAIRAGQLKREIAPAAFLTWLQGLRIAVPPGLASAVAELMPAKPAPQKPASASSPFNIKGYDCPPELKVMLEAINQFWVNVDRNKPPKKEEIAAWTRAKVDSDAKANAIDVLIRPEWARSGGLSKLAKG